MMRLSLGLLTLLLWLPCCGAGDLHLLDRFGPDGLPFTRDDPLAVGAFASEFRIGAMAGDACSEEADLGLTPPVPDRSGSGGGSGAHGYPGGHPAYDKTGRSKDLEGNHKARPNPRDLFNAGPPVTDNLITKTPLDMAVWLAAINLESGTVHRMRVFPDDLQWEGPDGNLGDWGPGGNGLGDVWTGSQTQDLHLDTFGLSYRDIKNPGGLALGINKETWKKIGLTGIELDMAVQQVFVESFVMEMMNLQTNKAALSGNHTMDLAGLQLFIGFDNMPGKKIIDLSGLWPGDGSCTASLDGATIRLGDHVDPKTPFTGLPSEYFRKRRLPIVIEKVAFTGTLDFTGAPWPFSKFDKIDCQSLYDGIMVEQSTGTLGSFLRILKNPPSVLGWQPSGIDVIDLVNTWVMDSNDKIKDRLDYLDDLAASTDTPAMKQQLLEVAKYSGLAGPPQTGTENLKGPFDRLALGTLDAVGQFHPQDWGEWQGVGDPPVLKQVRGMHRLQDKNGTVMSKQEFEAAAGGTLISVEDRLQNRGGWRYNGGGTYLSKSAMLFGNSLGAKNQSPKGYRNDPDFQFEYDPLEAYSDEARKQLPDLLTHYARWWIHPRLDLIDPYIQTEEDQAAAWTSLDILFDHGADPSGSTKTKSLPLDWPPPNYNFGRSQILAFRAGSGGVPKRNTTGGEPPYNVKTGDALLLQGMASVDLVSGTLSIAGGLTKPGQRSLLFGTPLGGSNSPRFGWSPIMDFSSQAAPSSNLSKRRWLTGGANHHFEGNAEFEWRWDLDGDGTTDSPHLQQMADVEPYAGLFAYQTTADGGKKGRTGFFLVPTNDPAREALEKLAESR
jgi:hypothetical protein